MQYAISARGAIDGGGRSRTTLEGDELATAGQGMGSSKALDQDIAVNLQGRSPNLCQINVDQSDGRHSFVFFWIESVPIKFAACGMLDL
jgi:hypothetical protein